MSAAIIEQLAAVVQMPNIEDAILAAYERTETNGLEFGRLCYEYRKNHGAQGSRTGQGLAQLLRKLAIKEGKAYYWIAEHERVIGVRQPKVEETEPESEPEPEPTEGETQHEPPQIEEQPPLPPQTKTKTKPPLLQQAAMKLVNGVRIRLNGVIYKTNAEPELRQEKGGMYLRVPVEVA